MATNVTEVKHGRMHQIRVYTWTLTDGETGEAIVVPELSDVTVQAEGTWGGATVTFMGTIIPDLTVNKWFQAKNPLGVLISFTVDAGDLVLPNYYHLRPKITRGSSSSVNIYVMLK